MKRTIYQEDMTVINIYKPNIVASKYIKKLLKDLKETTDNNTITIEDFNTQLTSMGC